MSEKVINFSTLKRKEIKALIHTENGEVKIEYDQKKIKELQEKLENPILIFNPINEKRAEMEKIIAEIGNKSLKNKLDLIIEAKDLILRFLPICTNIILDLDENIDNEIIKDIIEDPSDEFNAIISEVTKLTKKVSEDYIKTIKTLSEMPKEQLDEVLKINVPVLTKKEQKRLKLQKQLEELDKEDKIEEIKE